jgi:hypothetical protein
MARTKGTPDLKPVQKARILAKKNAELYGHKKIAEEEGVSLSTVEKTKIETVEPEVLKLYPQETAKLEQRIARVRDKALNALEVEIDKGEVPANHLSTIFGTLYDKHRLETGQATEITQNLSAPLLVIRRGWSIKQSEMTKEEYVEFTMSSGIPEIKALTREEIEKALES